MKRALKLTCIAAVSGFAMMSQASFAAEYNFKFQSSDPSGNPNFILQQGWTKALSEKTGGRVEVELLPVGSIVQYKETQDAIAAGIIDGHITDTSYFAGKDAAFGLIANPVGAWSAPEEMFDFMENGGGNELMNQLVEPYGLHFIGATTPGLEAFVSSIPIDTVADLKGVKLRAPEGLVQQVFAAAGAAPVNLPGSEVFTGLDKGVIDAADYSVFSVNQSQGLNDIAMHPIYPGFHSLPMVEISMNKVKWDSLPSDIKTAFIDTVKNFSRHQVAELAKNDEAAVKAAKAGGKITVHNWSAEERAKFRTIAMGEWEKVAVRSDNAQKVFITLTSYLKANGLVN
jgi:TRAP-type C4-dicarboxylate transport system substrate-binding protein